MPPIEPYFSPGSGWLLRTGTWSAGTPDDIEERQHAALLCTVFRMREFGMRLPPAAMLNRPGVSGALLSHHPNGMQETWEVHLYRPKDMHNDLLQKLNVSQLIRENDGVRVYQGQEYNKEVGQHYRQTWLCTPTLEAGRAILAKMAAK